MLVLIVMVVCSAVLVLGATLYQAYLTRKALKMMDPQVRDLFQKGWVLPEDIELHGLTSFEDDVYYPILHRGQIELAHHSKGRWSFEPKEPPLDGTFYVYRPRESAINTP